MRKYDPETAGGDQPQSQTRLNVVCFQDSCVRQATRCVRWAKLVTLQQHFLNQGSELRLINLQPAELPAALAALPRCFQVGRPSRGTFAARLR